MLPYGIHTDPMGSKNRKVCTKRPCLMSQNRTGEHSTARMATMIASRTEVVSTKGGTPIAGFGKMPFKSMMWGSPH